MKLPAWFSAAVAILVAMVFVSNRASAANVFVLDISGTGPRDFNDSTIWPSGVLPTNVDHAIIDQGDGLNDYVYVDGLLQIQRFNIGNQNSGGLELRSGAYLFTNQQSFQNNVGPSGSAAGSLPGVGFLRIKSGATLEHSGLLYIGLNPLGTGTVTLEDGGTHIVGGALAIRDGVGTYNMLGGHLEVGGFFQVARLGQGMFTQSGGTLMANHTLATQQGMFIAAGLGASATYEISGGSLTVAANNLGVINGFVSTDPEAGGSTGIFRIVGSAPTVTIGTNYDQRNGSRFEVVIDEGGVSPMNVGGDVSLLGGLGVSFNEVPTVGQEFTIMNYTGSLSGTFTDFAGFGASPLGANSVSLSIDYGTLFSSAVKLTVNAIQTAVPGDFNADGNVDGADFVIWQTNFPNNTGTATLAMGDANADGNVDGADFVIWQTNFPTVAGAGATPVPEPNSLLLAVMAGLGLVAARRWAARSSAS